ncbi:MAG: hypothetical protein K1W13_04300 [Lachnospiraceae bacterium]
MFAVFEEEKWITILMFTFLSLSILSRIIIGIRYQNMIRQTENMSTTSHKALKQCKLKFANCYQLNGGVSNIPIFVDKFLNKLKLGPLLVQTVYHLSGQFMLLSVFCSGLGVCLCLVAGHTIGDILPFYIVSFLGLYLYYSVSAIADVKGRRRILKTNLVDYLENHMASRLRAGLPPEAKEGAKTGIKEPKTGIELMPVHAGGNVHVNNAAGANAAVRTESGEGAEEKESDRMGRIFSLSEQKELEELLREFLTS